MKIELVAITPNAVEVIENAGRTCYQSEANKEAPSIFGDLAEKFL